jgi:hypothetical protein
MILSDAGFGSITDAISNVNRLAPWYAGGVPRGFCISTRARGTFSFRTSSNAVASQDRRASHVLRLAGLFARRALDRHRRVRRAGPTRHPDCRPLRHSVSQPA